MYCRQCGASLPEGAVFCGECGRRIQGAAADDGGGSSERGSLDGPESGVPSRKRKVLLAASIAAIVVLLAIVALVVVSCPADRSGQGQDAGGSAATDYSAPTDAYDIAGVVGMNPASMEGWLNSHSYTTYDGGGNSFARLVIDGTEEVPASDDPSNHTGWETLSVQMYTLLSSVPEGADIESVFDTDESVEIPPSSLAESSPRAATFMSTERAKESSDLPENTRDYMDVLIERAGLEPNETAEDDEGAYAIGSCEIDGKDGIWIAFSEKADGSYNGYILCGYADDMEKSLGITGADAASLGALAGIDASSAASAKSGQGGQLDAGDYTITPSGEESVYTNIPHGYSITVPSSYKVSASDFGNKLFFTDAASGMEITVSCEQNHDNLTVQQCYDRLAAGKDISYRHVGSDSCVASYVSDGDVHYDKDIVGSWSVLSITFTYPVANKATCDKLLEEIVKTIEPGDLNVEHEL